MDAALLANELVNANVKQGRPGILCKLDIEKAYDHVNWVFLTNMPRNIGFGVKWINRIKCCISSVKFSVLINGRPEVLFPSNRGLRQGDPLSQKL